jgi:serine/threonine protein kinase
VSRSSEGSTSRTPASLRIVEKRGSTSLLSILTSCLREIPAARANSSWVINLPTLSSLTLCPIFTAISIDTLIHFRKLHFQRVTLVDKSRLKYRSNT